MKEPRVPRRARLVLVGYLVMPFDVIPDFIPVIGLLDDALLVAVSIAYLVRLAGRDVVEEHWPGSERGLRILLSLGPEA